MQQIEEYAIKSGKAQNIILQFYHSSFYSFIRKQIEQYRSVKMVEEIKKYPIPNHIAIIMDGNRRFAKTVGIQPNTGHFFGRDKIEETLNWCLELGIKNLTLYAFSTENFKRTPNEVSALMNICEEELKKALADSKIHKNEVRINVIGNIASLSKTIQHQANILIEQTKKYKKHTLTIALAYGGRQEIIQAIIKIAQDVKKGNLSVTDIDEEKVSSYLYTNDIPDPDLILRTSGEERISNFLLWQMAYAEFYFSDVYWPAFRKRDFLKAIRTYQQRKRRYGK